ncbi:MAG TPA: hypothetical protein VGJ33_01025 [Candidatus Angelobacter sp.]
MRLLYLSLFLCLFASLVSAEDITCSDFQAFADPANAIRNGSIADYAAVKRLVDKDLADKVPDFDKTKSSAIIHIVTIENAGQTTVKDATGKDEPAISIAVKASHWYTYDPDGRYDWSHGATRLFGRSNPYVILIFLSKVEEGFNPSYTYTVTGRLSAPIQDLSDVATVFKSVVGSSNLTAHLKKLSDQPESHDVFCWAQLSVATPSDIVITPALLPNATEAKPQNIDQKPTDIYNEGLYRWDASIGVPIISFKQLQTVTSGAGDVTANVDKRNLFALGDFYLFQPVDVQKQTLITVPYLVGGAAIASKPLHAIFAGVGWGPVIAKFYGGFLITTNNLPNHKTERTIKGAFGLNLPVRSIMGKLGIKSELSTGK